MFYLQSCAIKPYLQIMPWRFTEEHVWQIWGPKSCGDYCLWFMLQEFGQPQSVAFCIVHHRDLIIKLNSCSGAEKKGLWSVSMTKTSLGGHFLIMESCCWGSSMRSRSIFMKIRLIRFNLSSSPSKLAVLIAAAGHGRISIEASTDSYTRSK